MEELGEAELFTIEAYLPGSKPSERRGKVSELFLGYIVKTEEGHYVLARTKDRTLAHKCNPLESRKARLEVRNNWLRVNRNNDIAFKLIPVDVR